MREEKANKVPKSCVKRKTCHLFCLKKNEESIFYVKISTDVYEEMEKDIISNKMALASQVIGKLARCLVRVKSTSPMELFTLASFRTT